MPKNKTAENDAVILKGLTGVLASVRDRGAIPADVAKSFITYLKLLQKRSKKYEMAIAACRQLVTAYKAGEESGSVDWSDVDLAHELAKDAL